MKLSGAQLRSKTAELGLVLTPLPPVLSEVFTRKGTQGPLKPSTSSDHYPVLPATTTVGIQGVFSLGFTSWLCLVTYFNGN